MGDGSKTTSTASATSKVRGAPNAHRFIMMGGYETNIVCSKALTGDKNSIILYFSGFDGESANSMPIVLMGLNMLEMGNTELDHRTIEHTRSFANGVIRGQFSIHFNFNPNTTWCNAKASWLRLASATSSGILAGMYNASEAKRSTMAMEGSCIPWTVEFGTTFPGEPKVFVGHSRFEFK
ncbi:unnamed protein product [Calypogeia fissa]